MKIHMFFFLLCLFFLSCNKEKDCPPCENGGTCIDGSCVCVGLWTGPNCSQQITPTWIFVDRVTLTTMPATDNGAGWDLTSGPDLYIIIKQNGVVKYTSQDTPVTNGNTGAAWTGQINLTPEPVTIELWDADDFDADDYMGGIISEIYKSDNGFPETLNLSCGACVVSFRLSEIQYL